MKKHQESRITRTFKSIFNVRSWMDYDRVKSFSTYLWQGTKKTFVPQPKKVEDQSNNFEDYVARMNLSEDDLSQSKNALFKLSIFMFCIGFGFFAYLLYQLFTGGHLAVIVSLAVMIIAFAMSFRYHFWYYQITQRKLGCSLQEWYHRGLLGEKK